VSRAISDVKGVSKVDVSFAQKKAVVQSTRCDDSIDAEIAKSLDDAGYGGEVIERKPSS